MGAPDEAPARALSGSRAPAPEIGPALQALPLRGRALARPGDRPLALPLGPRWLSAGRGRPPPAPLQFGASWVVHLQARSEAGLRQPACWRPEGPAGWPPQRDSDGPHFVRGSSGGRPGAPLSPDTPIPTLSPQTPPPPHARPRHPHHHTLAHPHHHTLAENASGMRPGPASSSPSAY